MKSDSGLSLLAVLVILAGIVGIVIGFRGRGPAMFKELNK